MVPASWCSSGVEATRTGLSWEVTSFVEFFASIARIHSLFPLGPFSKAGFLLNASLFLIQSSPLCAARVTLNSSSSLISHSVAASRVW